MRVPAAVSVSVDQVTAHLDADDLDRDAVEHNLELLIQRGLVKGFSSVAGLQGVWLQPAGKAKAEEFDRLRRDPVLRRQQLQDLYLIWLYDEVEVRGGVPDPNAFLATSPGFHGVPFTPDELERAGALLEKAGFIEGPSVDQYDAPLRPRTTEKGRKVVEGSRSVHDPEPAPAQHFTTTVHGNANVANASPGAAQTLVVANWGTEVIKVLDAIEQAVSTLPEDMSAEVELLIDSARNAVAADSPSRAKRALAALGGFLGDTASGALGALLGAQVLALLPLLGT